MGPKHILRLLWVATLCLACGEATSNHAESAAGYPEGPYGIEVGDVVENLTFQTHEGETLSFADLRGTGAAALVLFNTAGWCVQCTECMPELLGLHERYADRGLLTMVSIFQSRHYDTPSVRDAAFFRRSHALEIPVLADTNAVVERYFPRVSLPMVMIVNLETMTLLSAKMEFEIDAAAATLEGHLWD